MPPSRRGTRCLLAGVLVPAAVMVTACSGGGEDATPSTAPAATAAPATAADGVAAGTGAGAGPVLGGDAAIDAGVDDASGDPVTAAPAATPSGAEATSSTAPAPVEPASSAVPPGVRPDRSAPPCTAEALDATAAPDEAHTWDDVLCVSGYAHAYLTYADPAVASSEVVFYAERGAWRELVRGAVLDGAPALAGVPADVLVAFQLAPPAESPPPPASVATPPEAAAPCTPEALAAASVSVPPGTSLREWRCVAGYARARADLGSGTVLDMVFAAGPSGWRELASGAELTASPAVAALPPDVRAELGL